MKTLLSFLVACMMLLLNGCGQTGPLYLPGQKPPVYVPPPVDKSKHSDQTN